MYTKQVRLTLNRALNEDLGNLDAKIFHSSVKEDPGRSNLDLVYELNLLFT